MSKKHVTALLLMAVVGMGAAGCFSTKTTMGITPHKIKVVDGPTQHPVAGATVQLSGPGCTMGQKTDERGFVRVGSYGFYSLPRLDTIEVAMEGYHRVLFRLTNGLPSRIGMTPIGGQKP